MNEEQWRWKYLTSNVGLLNQLAFDSQGNVMGHAGAIALRGQAYGMSIPFYQITDVMVHPQARGYLGINNLFTQLLRVLLVQIKNTHPQVLAYGFPGLRPFVLGERVWVYEKVERAREYVWNVNELNGVGLLAIAASWDDVPFDVLWQRLGHQFPVSLIRDSDYIHWRYIHNPFRSYQLLELCWLKESIGWAVLYIRANEVLIVDFLIARNLCLHALRSISNWVKAHGWQIVRLWVGASWRSRLSLSIVDAPVVVTNMRWGLPWPTDVLSADLFYTMGDVDVF